MKKQNLVAFIKSEVHNGLTIREDNDYATKKSYKADLKANGYVVYAILTDAEVNAIQNRRNLSTREEIDLDVKYTKMHKDLVDYVDQCL